MHRSLEQDARLLGRGADVSFSHASELAARCAHTWKAFFASGGILMREDAPRRLKGSVLLV